MEHDEEEQDSRYTEEPFPEETSWPEEAGNQDVAGVPGAQIKALWKGFYSCLFKEWRAKNSGEKLVGELKDEIALMRLLIFEVVKAIHQAEKAALTDKLPL